MEEINIASRPNNLSGDSQPIINRKTKANFEEIDERLNSIANSILKVKELDLAVNEDGHTISGAGFTPPLASPPAFYRAYQVVNDEYVDISGIIDKIVKNGDVYDVKTTAISEELLNVKIVIL